MENELRIIEPSIIENNLPTKIESDKLKPVFVVIPNAEYRSMIEELQQRDDEDFTSLVWKIFKFMVSSPIFVIKMIWLIINLITRGKSMFDAIFKSWRTTLLGFVIAVCNFLLNYMQTGQPWDMHVILYSIGAILAGMILPDFAFVKQYLEEMAKKHKE